MITGRTSGPKTAGNPTSMTRNRQQSSPGRVLTHSDWTPGNVLISGHRAWLIDWAWPTLGADWTDPPKPNGRHPAFPQLTLEIVRRPDDLHTFQVLPRRRVVERTLAWITRCRRTVRDYERLPGHHETMVHWAMTITRRLARRRPAISRALP